MSVLLPMLLLSSSPLQLSGPERAPGDPATTVLLSLTVDSAMRAAKVTLAADAGTLGEPGELAPTRFEVGFTPPRVAVSTPVTVTATLAGGARAAWRLLVDPVDPDPPIVSSAGPLALRAPAYARAGRGAVTIALRSPVEPVVQTTVGRLSDPVPDGAGGWEVRYTPPESGPPRIALLTAWSGTEVDWLPLPVHGLAKVSVSTSRRAAVTLKVGSASFGPFRSTPEEPLQVPVPVPLGVRHYTSSVVDASGRAVEEKVALRAPPPGAVYVIPSPDASRVLVIAIGDDGRVISSEPELESSDGTLTRLGDSLWALAPPPHARPGDRVELLARSGSASGNASLTLPERQPTALGLSLEPPAWSAGGPPVAVRVALEGPGPFADDPVELSVSAGSVSALRWEGRHATAAWTPPAALPEGGQATLRARRGALASEATLALRPGPVAKIEVAAEQERLRADGRSETRVVVIARDAAGNTAGPEGIEVSAGGSLTPLASLPDGTLAATYRAPVHERRRADVITARAGGVEGNAELVLLPAWAPWTVGVSAGYVSNFGRVSAPVTTIEAHAALPWAPALGLGLSAGYYRSRARVPLPELDESGELAVDVAPVTLAATARWRLAGGIDGYAGAGAGAFFARAAFRSPSAGETASDASAFGATLVAGLETGRTSGRWFFEVGYWEARARRGPVHGSLGGARAAAGYRHAF